MLLRFSVENFRSIAQKQTLDMAASRYFKEDLESHTVSPESKGTLPRILKTVAIYGPNAAGKSSLIRALSFFREFVVGSATNRQAGDSVRVEPFRLSSEFREGDSLFEVVFFERSAGSEGDSLTRYQYGFRANRQRVMEEWLVAYPRGRSQHWFHRTFFPKENEYRYNFAPSFRGGRLRDDWKAQTRDNALFLSTAVQFNSEQLKPVLEWFSERLNVVATPHATPFRTFERLESDPEKKVMGFLGSMDLSVTGIRLEPFRFSADRIPPGLPPHLQERMIRDLEGKEFKELKFLHRSSDGTEDIPFSPEEESEGTRNLFLFAGIWLDMMERGQVLVIDEIDTSLHPLVVRSLVDSLHCAGCRGQLIFTTHDSSLLSGGGLRRDQIWFVRKSSSGATELYPLSDFPVQKGEAIERRYLNGRYGAVPFIEGFPK